MKNRLINTTTNLTIALLDLKKFVDMVNDESSTDEFAFYAEQAIFYAFQLIDEVSTSVDDTSDECEDVLPVGVGSVDWDESCLPF